MIKNLTLIVAILFLFQTKAWAVSRSAEVEVLEANATLQFHSKQYVQALATIKQILAADPKSVGALELLALIQRENNNDNAALKIYKKLMVLGPFSKKAAYHFEYATLRYKQKRYDDAYGHFSLAATRGFNTGTSHFFLGVIDFNNKDYQDAIHHFSAALTYSDATPLKNMARYYLASSFAQTGNMNNAIQNYNMVAEDTAPKNSETPTPNDSGLSRALRQSSSATGIYKNALQSLREFDKADHYINLSLLTQWDSNVQTNPISSNTPDIVSSERSLKTIFSGAGSYSTSPLDPFQFIAGYQLFTNYNYNNLARDFNFFSQTLSTTLMYKSYKRFSLGFIADGSHSMKNNLTSTDTGNTMRYQHYSLTADMGLLFKFVATPRINLSEEVVWRPKRFFMDPTTGSTRRSGNGVFSKLTADFITGMDWARPSAYFTYEIDRPSGYAYQMNAFGGGVSNFSSITEDLKLTLFFDLTSTDYFATFPKRDDVNLSFRELLTYIFNSNWSAMMDFSYISNNSSVTSTYQYDRYVTSLGASYAF